MPGITIQITGDGAGAAQALQVIEERMQQTATRGKEMSSTLEAAGQKVQAAFQMVGIGLGIQQALDGIKSMIEKSIDLGVELGHLSQQTGISTENLSTLKYISDQTGVSFEGLSKGFKKLSTDLFELSQGGKGAGGVEKAFQAIGVSEKELTATGGDLFKVMELVAAKFQEMPDGYKKNAVATQLFGRAGQDLIPILNQGADGVEAMRAKAAALGIVLDEQGVAKMEELHKKTVDLKAAFEGAGLAITGALAPALESLAEEIPKVLGMGAANGEGSDFAAGLKAIGDAFNYITVRADRYRSIIMGISDAHSGVIGQLDIKGGTIGKLAPHAAGGGSDSGGDGFSIGGKAGPVTAGYNSLVDNMSKIPGAAAEAKDQAAGLAADLADANQNAQGIAGAMLKIAQPVPNVSLDPDAYKQAAKMAEIHRLVQERMDADQEKADNGTGLNYEAARQAAGTVGSFMDQMTEQALHGKISFTSLVDSAIQDLERFAMKVLEERTLLPILNSLFGGGGAAGMTGGFADTVSVMPSDTLSLPMMAGGGELGGNGDMAVVGDGGDGSGSEIFAPKGPGTILPHDVVEGIAASRGGGNGAPNVMINNVNNSSQAVDMKQNGVSWDGQAKQFIIHTVLEDAASGGPVAGMLSGFASK